MTPEIGKKMIHVFKKPILSRAEITEHPGFTLQYFNNETEIMEMGGIFSYFSIAVIKTS